MLYNCGKYTLSYWTLEINKQNKINCSEGSIMNVQFNKVANAMLPHE